MSGAVWAAVGAVAVLLITGVSYAILAWRFRGDSPVGDDDRRR